MNQIFRELLIVYAFQVIGVHLNSASFDYPVDQLNKHAEKKNKKINPDFSGGNDNHA